MGPGTTFAELPAPASAPKLPEVEQPRQIITRLSPMGPRNTELYATSESPPYDSDSFLRLKRDFQQLQMKSLLFLRKLPIII